VIVARITLFGYDFDGLTTELTRVLVVPSIHRIPIRRFPPTSADQWCSKFSRPADLSAFRTFRQVCVRIFCPYRCSKYLGP